MSRIAVVGAGVSGLAAAYAAATRDSHVVVFDAGMGAASWGSGAIDDMPWEERETALRSLNASPLDDMRQSSMRLSENDLAFCRALGVWKIPTSADALSVLATTGGRLRTARGREASVLNLRALAGRRVLIPRALRPRFDADCIARSLAADPLAEELGLEFEAADCAVLRFVDEHRLNDVDLAARFDEAPRLRWLANQLRLMVEKQSSPVGGILLGPWLGSSAPRADALTEMVGLPVGELTDPLGTGCGARFDAAKRNLLERLGVRVLPAATRMLRESDRFRLFAGETRVSVEKAILAMGGVASGGLRLREFDPKRPARDRRTATSFALSVPYDAMIGGAPTGANWAGRGQTQLAVMGSLTGPTLDQSLWPSATEPADLERVGLSFDSQLQLEPDLYVCGDLMADRPRTILHAVASGTQAGERASL